MDALAKINLKKIVTFIVFMGIIILSLFIFNRYFYQHQVALADAEQSLSETGTIEATNVMASFKVAGKLEKIFVDEGNKVEAGQEIAFLEDQEISSDLISAQGAYNAAVGDAQRAADAISLTSQQVETTIAQTQAKVAQAEIGVKDAKLSFDRATALVRNGSAPQKTLDDATNAYNLALSKLKEAQAALEQVMSARANVTIAEAQYQAAQGVVKQADGAVQKANAYLSDTHLLSPMSGFITQKYLQAGEMLNAGTPVYEITDLAHPYVNVYISEAKIGRVHLNQEAEISVDAFPGKVFKGKVVLVNGAGEFAVKKAINEQYEHDIRSFQVKIDIPNQDLALKTGMTAKVKILEEAK
ncbi:multidrug resistance efflux pump [Desulfosporosinus orientis DSM 765]|uniref:Multidrug resistance efflux pump n=1 Tax=Desulfosporosinus orientis (strain ATCC 19365 / DSM 765 / NCIMB 8382 / VKM B-1628 / Singapore I) TaxID=768706 RepID=G7W8D5_DESOD|nr:HlyD family efflux transporter periplasmic adaptor subunit [Desulfosporosinus orientis]AET67075.1 multidrug resistance efflux pump [Desulfosporosinus orientis DSM 765]